MWKGAITALFGLLFKKAPNAIGGFSRLSVRQESWIDKVERRLDAAEKELEECRDDRADLREKLKDCERKLRDCERQHLVAESRIQALETKTAV